MWVRHQQRPRGHDHPRRAVAALDGEFLNKAALEHIQLAVFRKALDRQHMPSLQLDRQRQAGVHRPAVNDHGAGAAFPLGAAFLGSRQVQILTQNVEQPSVRLRFQRHRPRIHIKAQRHLLLSFARCLRMQSGS